MSKATLLILSLTFLTYTEFNLATYSADAPKYLLHDVSNTTLISYKASGIALLFLLFPVGGFIGDIWCGRYRAIKTSLPLMMVKSVFLIAMGCLLIVRLKNPGVFTHGGVKAAALVVLCPLAIVGIGGIILSVANIIPFAMDQLRDAPAKETSLFIAWYYWVFSASWLLCLIVLSAHRLSPIIITSIGVNSNSASEAGVVLLITLPIFNLITLIVSLVVMHKRPVWFNYERGSLNPYKLVFKVTKFAYKHKIPLRRSAFTYCEDELPSGFDLGKSKYGGPFTVEEVEDVKVFYEILKVMLSLGPSLYLMTITMYSNGIYSPSGNSTAGKFDPRRVLAQCNGLTSLLVVVIIIPLWICISHRFRSCSLHAFRSLRKLEVGAALLLLNVVFMLGVNIASHMRKEDLKCMFRLDNDTPDPGFTLFEMAMILIIQQGLAGFSAVLVAVSAFEFICSQSPHSMKGMLIGLAYAIQGVILFLGAIIFFPFYYWTITYPSCGFLFYTMNVLIGLASFILLVWVAKRYKYRERDEPSRERQYAEDYYSKSLQKPNDSYFSVSLV